MATKSGQTRRRQGYEQHKLISRIQPGDVLVLSHRGYRCHGTGPQRSCSMNAILTRVRARRHGVFIFSTHVNGQIVVACADLKDEVPL